MGRWGIVGLGLAISALLILGQSCGAKSSVSASNPGRQSMIDDRAYTFSGLGIGDSREAVLATFPKPVQDSHEGDTNTLDYGTFVIRLRANHVISFETTDEHSGTSNRIFPGESIDRVYQAYGHRVESLALGMSHYLLLVRHGSAARGVLYFGFSTAYETEAQNKTILRLGIADSDYLAEW